MSISQVNNSFSVQANLAALTNTEKLLQQTRTADRDRKIRQFTFRITRNGLLRSAKLSSAGQ